METIIKLSQMVSRLFLLVVAMLTAGCGGTVKTTDSEISLDLDNYEGISTSIDKLCSSDHWKQDLFVQIVNGIDGAAGSGIIDKDMFQDKDLKEKLFKKSCFYLYAGIDSTFKCDTYRNIDNWKNMIPFLKKQNVDFMDSGVKLTNTNEHISQVEDILNHYYTVLKLSQTTCYKKAVYLKDYSYDIASIKNKIKQDPYYNIYFSNNKEILTNTDGLDNRRDHAHKTYMMELETLVEEHAVDNSLSLSDLLAVQSRFNQMARNAKADNAIRKLNNFVNDYVDPTVDPVIEE